MRAWLLYKKSESELTSEDHGVNRLLSVAKDKGVDLQVYRSDEFDIFSSNENANFLMKNKTQVVLPDVVIPRTGADSSYNAIALLRHLESQGVKLCNNVLSILNVKDKMLMNQKMRKAGLPSPKTLLLRFPAPIELIADEIGFPLVIKTLSGARGQGVFLCETQSQFRDVLGLLDHKSENSGFIVQEFIRESYGRDVRVFVLDGRVLGCMQRISNDGFKANFSLGGRVEAYALTPEVEALAQKTARLFNLDIAGIDLLFTKQGFTICEANSSPGFKGMEKAAKTDIASQIMDYVIEKSQR